MKKTGDLGPLFPVKKLDFVLTFNQIPYTLYLWNELEADFGVDGIAPFTMASSNFRSTRTFPLKFLKKPEH